MDHLLKLGTVLDERYRIDRILGEGGFGITYSAENLRIGMRVAVKELFLRGRCARNVAVSPEVACANAEDAALFEAQKARFLREAKALLDFSGLPGVARVLDYFEENGTAYIVMEYVEGETLGDYIARLGGRMDAATLLRRALPLIDTLGRIHAAGVIHRDISPDNIMVTPEGALTLIDFGAARAFTQGASPYTAIAKSSYSPPEQYDRNGKQGPWTDVYALCATLYRAVAGTPPGGAVQRMFLDELKAPGELGVELEPAYERIIMKGLQLEAERRYPTMEALADDIRAALPSQAEARGGNRLLAALAAGFALIAVCAVLWAALSQRGGDRFRGVETERLRLTAPGDMTAATFAERQGQVRDWLDDFAGRDNYEIDVEGAHIDVELPLSVYGGEEITPATEASLNAHFGEGGAGLYLSTQIVARWEDPATSLIAGKNQVAPEALEGETLLFAYTWSRSLTAGERANLLVDIKTCLDALETPYAFGTLYGNDDAIAFRLPPEHVGLAILDVIAHGTLKIAGEDGYALAIRILRNLYGGSDLQTSQGGDALRYERQYPSDESLERLTGMLVKNGEGTLYLESSKGYPLARAELEGPIADGRVEFSYMFEDPEDGAAAGWLTRFVDAVVNQTSMPAALTLSQVNVLDGEGKPLFDEGYLNHFGVRMASTDGDEAARAALRRMEADGLGKGRADIVNRMFSFSLGLEPNGELADRVAQLVPSLLEEYGLNDWRSGCMLLLKLAEGQGDGQCALFIHSRYDYEAEELYTGVSAVLSDKGRFAPSAEALRAWWRDFDADALGMRKEEKGEASP